MANKIDLRIKAKKIRKTLPMKEISTRLVNLIRKNKEYGKAKNVMLFYPTKFEVDLRGLLNDKKNFFLPRVKGENLEVCPYKTPFSEHTDNYAALKKSSMGIFEPCSNSVKPEILDLVIIPALMADKTGYRLGYGGGFYDRFIEKYGKSFKTICAVPKELFTDSLPCEDFDKKIDSVINNG